MLHPLGASTCCLRALHQTAPAIGYRCNTAHAHADVRGGPNAADNVTGARVGQTKYCWLRMPAVWKACLAQKSTLQVWLHGSLAVLTRSRKLAPNTAAEVESCVADRARSLEAAALVAGNMENTRNPLPSRDTKINLQLHMQRNGNQNN